MDDFPVRKLAIGSEVMHSWTKVMFFLLAEQEYQKLLKIQTLDQFKRFVVQ
jgi:hypothetical protein